MKIPIPLKLVRGSILAPLLILAACLAFAEPAAAEPSAHPLEIVPGSFQITPSTDQAAAHEDLTTSFDFAHSGAGLTAKTYNDVKTTVVNLPAGFIGSNTAVPTCTDAQLIGKTRGSPNARPPARLARSAST